MPFLLFLVYPLAELYTYYIFAVRYSFSEALLMTLTSGLLGLFLMLVQGRAVLMQLQSMLVQQKLPSKSLLHRGVLIFSGFCFFLPGLINDVIGILCILPGIRHLLVFLVLAKLSKAMARGAVFKNVFVFSGGMGRGGPAAGQGPWGAGQGPWGAGSTGFGHGPREEREATVVDITPKEISHKNRSE